ncbi:hypothetical protein J3R82DRAFT_9205 [Butyriboletus roseoflavus]|nr:hypothetical protein J3R82DRAFT_9205 [Butyriboletus roseoflavus]
MDACTYILNTHSLRAITRTLLATGTPSLAASFTAAARSRLRHTNAKRIATTNGLFATGLDGIHAVPTSELESVLARARSLYGAGMGFASLSLLSSVVKTTAGLRWEQEGSMADILAVVDTDICQAIQVGFRTRCRGAKMLIDVTRVAKKSSMGDV